MIGNTFAAFKGSETKKLMTVDGLKDRMGGVANQFAVTEVLAFVISVPVMYATEGGKFGEFLELCKTSKELQMGLAISGLSFYLYNELATMTIKATGAVTSSVANTAKRVIVMVYMAAVTGKVLTRSRRSAPASPSAACSSTRSSTTCSRRSRASPRPRPRRPSRQRRLRGRAHARFTAPCARARFWFAAWPPRRVGELLRAETRRVPP